MKKYKMYMIFNVLISLITIIFAIYCNKSNGYEGIFLIPLVYVILFITCKNMHKFSNNFGMICLNIIMFIKYVIAVFFIIYFQDFNSILNSNIPAMPKEIYVKEAIYYIVIEEIVIFSIINIFAKKVYKKEKEVMIPEVKKTSNNIVLYVFIILGLIFSAINFKYFFSFQNELGFDGENVGVAVFIINIFKLVVTLMLLNKCINSYKKSNNIKYVIFSIILVIVYLTLTITNSRISLLMAAIVLIKILSIEYQKYSKYLIVVIAIFIGISFINVTISKSEYLYGKDKSIENVLNKSLSHIQEYTGNVRPVALGLEEIEMYKDKITYETFFNDFLGSIPVISKYIDQNNRSNTYYNMFIFNEEGNTSLLMPNIVTSISFFTFLIPSFYTICFVMCLMKIDSTIITEKDIYIKYAKMYSCIVLAYSLGLTVQSVMGKIYNIVIPIMILAILNKKIRLKKENINE